MSIRRVVLVVAVIALIAAFVEFGSRAIKANQTIQATAANPAVTVHIPQYLLQEPEKRQEHMAYLAKLAACFKDECWNRKIYLNSNCRRDQRFRDLEALYSALEKDLSPQDSNVQAINIDPRIGERIDLHELKRKRNLTVSDYLQSLKDDFRKIVDAEADGKTVVVPACEPNHPELVSLLDRKQVLDRMLEVSAYAGLEGLNPTAEEVKHFTSFIK